MKAKNTKEELEDLSPSLLKIKEKGSGFRTPDNYFEKFSIQMMNRMEVEAVPESVDKIKKTWFQQFIQSISLLLSTRYAVGLASVFILTVSVVVLWNNNKNLNSTEEIVFSADVIDYYLSENIGDIDDELLLESGLVDQELDIFSELNIQSDMIDEYINEEILDDLDADDLDSLF